MKKKKNGSVPRRASALRREDSGRATAGASNLSIKGARQMDSHTEENEMKKGFDLSSRDTKLAAEQGVVVELEDPFDSGTPLLDDEGKPYTITILGSDAGPVRLKARKQLDQYLEAVRKNKNPGDAEKNEKELVDRLAAATIAWHMPPLDGAQLPEPTEHIARKLYSDPRFPWIVEQLAKAMGDRARFFKTSSTN